MSNLDGASHDEFYKSLLGDFLGESEHLLVSLNENLLQLDKWARSSKDTRRQQDMYHLIGELFRSAHSLKGLSNMLGLEEIERLIDSIEKVFDAARKDKIAVTGDVVKLMFEAIDRLGNLIDTLKDPDVPAVELVSIQERLAQLLTAAGTEPESSRAQGAEYTLGKIESQIQSILGGMESSHVSEASKSKPSTKPASMMSGSGEEQDAGGDKSESTAPGGGGGGRELFDELTDDADMSSRFMSIFIDETELALDQLTDTLLALEDGGSQEDLKHILVISHRIKGSAAAVGLNRAAKLSHLMEDLLQNMDQSSQYLSPDVTDAMLKCVDELRSYVQHLKEGAIPDDHFVELANELLQARRRSHETTSTPVVDGNRASESPKNKSSSPATQEFTGDSQSAEKQVSASVDEPMPETAPQVNYKTPDDATLVQISNELRNVARAAAPIGLPIYVGVATFQPNLALVSLKAELLHEKLSNLGGVCYFDPPPEELDDIETLDCIRFGLATERSEHDIHVALKTAGVLGAVVEPLALGMGNDISLQHEDQAEKTSEDGASDKQTSKQASTDTKPIAPEEAADQPKASSVANSKKGTSPPADSQRRPTETLRVDVDRLDQLMNLAGQLVVSKSRFAQISDSLRNVLGNKRSVLALNNVLQSLDHIAGLDDLEDQEAIKAEFSALCAQARRIHNQLEPMRREVESFQQMHASVNELEEAVHQLDRVADDIQKNVMDTRMVPIGPLFTRFHRVVRDIMRVSGKTIRLAIHGEKTELDKRMIDELGDPLIHMVRNSADHGIEPPDVRARLGKPAEGTITLDAFHRGNSILVQISDDGCGLNPDQILAKAIENGLVNSREAEQLTTQQIYQLIWQPGFSTAQKVTEVSGRGIGMDIVKSRVESLNGTVELESEPGKGMTITIKLPLTLAILPSLMVEVSGDVFAMPMESVSEIVRIPSEEISTVHGKLAAQVRGRVISIVDLDDVFQWRDSTPQKRTRTSGLLTLVIVGEGEEEIGLAIDRVIGEEDVVIKSMADNYRNVPGIAGASVLGSGRVSLILDLAAVIAMAAHPNGNLVSVP